MNINFLPFTSLTQFQVWFLELISFCGFGGQQLYLESNLLLNEKHKYQVLTLRVDDSGYDTKKSSNKHSWSSLMKFNTGKTCKNFISNIRTWKETWKFEQHYTVRRSVAHRILTPGHNAVKTQEIECVEKYTEKTLRLAGSTGDKHTMSKRGYVSIFQHCLLAVKLIEQQSKTISRFPKQLRLLIQFKYSTC